MAIHMNTLHTSIEALGMFETRPPVGPRGHGGRQTALKRTIDGRRHLACHLVALEFTKRQDHVLPKVPERFHVLRKPYPLPGPAHPFTLTGFQQHEHHRPGTLEVAIVAAAFQECR